MCIAKALAAARTNSCTNRYKFGQGFSPLVPCDLKPHADNTVGTKRVGLLLHTRHSQLTRMIHGLSEDVHFLVLSPASKLESDMINGTAYYEANRVKACFPHQ